MNPLTSPPPRARLVLFPAYILQPTQPLFRIHRAVFRPWWFGGTGASRFDLRHPNGTCYLAEDELGALVEVFQDWIGAPLPYDEVLARAISTVSVPRPMTLAHSFGVTAEIHSIGNRRRTRAWAAAFRRAGFEGVRYLVRHDPAQQ